MTLKDIVENTCLVLAVGTNLTSLFAGAYRGALDALDSSVGPLQDFVLPFVSANVASGGLLGVAEKEKGDGILYAAGTGAFAGAVTTASTMGIGYAIGYGGTKAIQTIF